jgi:hypothetical protein
LTDDSTGGRTAMEETIDISADNPTMMEESETEPAMEQSVSILSPYVVQRPVHFLPVCESSTQRRPLKERFFFKTSAL